MKRQTANAVFDYRGLIAFFPPAVVQGVTRSRLDLSKC